MLANPTSASPKSHAVSVSLQQRSIVTFPPHEPRIPRAFKRVLYQDCSARPIFAKLTTFRQGPQEMTDTLFDEWHDFGTQAIFIIITVTIVLAPVLRYIRAGWKYKSLDIINSIDDGAQQLYLEQFQKQAYPTVSAATVEFYRAYYRRFGRRYFIVPVLILAALVVIASSLSIESILQPTKPTWSAKLELNAAALAALAGAYMWVVSDFIWRGRRMDFAPGDILWGSLRIFIAAPMGLAFGGIIEPKVLAFVAFGLGAFPLETIQSFLRQLSAKTMNVQIGASQTSELLNLNGVDQNLSERLEQEDIRSIVQLAYCDPIQLTMRSNLSFNSVVDLVSQALAWVYIEHKLPIVRTYGLRGAYEFRELCEHLDGTDAGKKTIAQNLLPLIAQALDVSEQQMWFVINEIANDPYTEFIYKTWS
jgi:hypothetical protein